MSVTPLPHSRADARGEQRGSTAEDAGRALERLIREQVSAAVLAAAQPVPDRLLLTVEQAAAQLGVSPRTVGTLLAEGLLPVVRPRPKCTRIAYADLVSYVERLTREGGAR